MRIYSNSLTKLNFHQFNQDILSFIPWLFKIKSKNFSIFPLLAQRKYKVYYDKTGNNEKINYKEEEGEKEFKNDCENSNFIDYLSILAKMKMILVKIVLKIMPS